MDSRHTAALLLALALALGLCGCATNLSEARSARVLRGGEIQVAQANSVNFPVRVIGDVIDPGKQIVSSIDQGTPPTDEEAKKMVGAAAAIALTGVGYGTHIDVGVGLGYRLDLSARVGNGIYGLSLRRGFELGSWDACVGARAAYNSGATWVPYFDDLNSYVEISDTKRFDGQLFGQIGRDFGEWGKIWFGAKGMVSPFSSTVDTTLVGLGRTELSDTIGWVGGFFGFALGYRWFHFLGELAVLYSIGEVEAYGYRYDLSGVVVVPTWGLQLTF